MATLGGWASSSGIRQLRTCYLAAPTTTRSGTSMVPGLMTWTWTPPTRRTIIANLSLSLFASGAPLGCVPSGCRPQMSNQGGSEARLPPLSIGGAAAVRQLQRRWQQAGGHLQGQKGSGPGPTDREDPTGVPLGFCPVCVFCSG